jgi:hypothetical protein
MIDAVCPLPTVGAQGAHVKPDPVGVYLSAARSTKESKSVYLGGRNGVDVLGAGIGQHIRQERRSGVDSDILKFRGPAAGFDQDLQTQGGRK